VRDDTTERLIDWSNNQAITTSEWDAVNEAAMAFEATLEKIYEQQLYAGRDENLQLGLTVKTSFAWHALFANNMFVRDRVSGTSPEDAWELCCFPQMKDNPKVYINFSCKKIIIYGTHYAGEIKKSIFTVLNFILPSLNVLPMHCSVNTSTAGQDPAIFFGLSGTGKTTLSASPGRVLIGDDEHGWSPIGVFNFEGGCYAKVINLDKDSEPEIWNAVQAPGAILENVVVSDEGIPQFCASDYTENTRGSYPIDHIPNASSVGTCTHPKNIIFLTCDAFGVLPPVARLSATEAVDHFLMGYTAKVAGTEAGVAEPMATFSHCFGAPFMPLYASRYADLLRSKVELNDVKCWLVNTGWSGGAYGVGERIPIAVSRAIIDLILSDAMISCDFFRHRHTNLLVPLVTPDDNVNTYIHPERRWADTGAYEASANRLMKMWKEKLSDYAK